MRLSNDRPLPSSLGVTFNLRYHGEVSAGWTPSGYIHRLRNPTASSASLALSLSTIAVGEKFSRVCGEEDFCLDALP